MELGAVFYMVRKVCMSSFQQKKSHLNPSFLAKVISELPKSVWTENFSCSCIRPDFKKLLGIIGMELGAVFYMLRKVWMSIFWKKYLTSIWVT